MSDLTATWILAHFFKYQSSDIIIDSVTLWILRLHHVNWTNMGIELWDNGNGAIEIWSRCYNYVDFHGAVNLCKDNSLEELKENVFNIWRERKCF